MGNNRREKIIAFSAVLFTVLVFYAAYSYNKMHAYDVDIFMQNQQRQAESKRMAARERMEEILCAVEKEDADAIYAMFSKEAKANGLSKAEINEFIYSLKGKVVSYSISENSAEPVNILKVFEEMVLYKEFDIYCDDSRYSMGLHECLVNDSHKGREGVIKILLADKSTSSNMANDSGISYGISVVR